MPLILNIIGFSLAYFVYPDEITSYAGSGTQLSCAVLVYCYLPFTIVCSMTINRTVKKITDRERPTVDKRVRRIAEIRSKETTKAFPSGDAAFGMIFGT